MRKMSHMKLIENVSTLRKNNEFSGMMTRINDKERIRFIGVCSVTTNAFIPFLPSDQAESDIMNMNGKNHRGKSKFEEIKTTVRNSNYHHHVVSGYYKIGPNKYTQYEEKDEDRQHSTKIEGYIYKGKFCNIDQMFDLIVKDYLEGLDNETFLRIQTKKTDKLSLSENSQGSSFISKMCCR
jgi:hypothetical protein